LSAAISVARRSTRFQELEMKATNGIRRERGGRSRSIVLGALAVVALLAVGAVLASAPRHRSFRSLPNQAADNLAVQIEYPSGWTASIGDGDRLDGHVMVQPAIPRGFEEWIDRAVYHAQPSDWRRVKVEVQLENSGLRSDIEKDENRMQQAFAQLRPQGVVCSVHRDHCAAGDLLVAHMDGPGAGDLMTMLVYPPRAQGGPQYEVGVICWEPSSLRSRVEPIAMEIASSVKLVSERAAGPSDAK